MSNAMKCVGKPMEGFYEFVLECRYPVIRCGHCNQAHFSELVGTASRTSGTNYIGKTEKINKREVG